MCLSCGCMMPDDDHGDERYIVMQDLVDAAQADSATVEQIWRNIVETMDQVREGKLKSRAWTPLNRFV